MGRHLLAVLVAVVSFVAAVAEPALAHELLRLGSRGPSVSSWQQQLNVVRQPDIAVDGVFGPITAAATRDLQSDGGLAPDGIVGPQTRHAMQHALARHPDAHDRNEPTPRGDLRLVRDDLALDRGDRGEPVMALQRLLNATVLRDSPLATDGIFGPVTERAVRDFQRAQRLSADGIVGPQTMAALEAIVRQEVVLD